MSKIEIMNREQVMMNTFCLDDLIDQENEARGIDIFVDYLDLNEVGIKDYLSGQKGQQPYSRKDLLKLHIYGYLNGIKSSRKLERECKRNIELIWLVNGICPDHGTISFFIKENKAAFKNIMKKLTIDLHKLGLIDFKLLAIDGTKIRAQNSKSNTISKSSIKQKENYVDGKIEEYINELSRLEDKNTDEIGEIQNTLKHYKSLKETYKSQKAILEEENIETKALNDGDSRKMKNHGTLEMCYNIQSVVDSKNHFIVNLQTTNDINDEKQLYPMSSDTVKTFGINDEITLVADTGYYNKKDIKQCVENDFQLIIKAPKKNNSTKNSSYSKDKFEYDSENDRYICPQKEILSFFENTSKDGIKYKKYKCSNCNTCPKKEYCTTSKTGRTIQRWEHEEILEKVDVYTKENEEIYYSRRAIVEHPFGYFKRAIGFTYFNRIGLETVEAETQLMGIAYNLRRVFSLFKMGELKEKILSLS